MTANRARRKRDKGTAFVPFSLLRKMFSAMYALCFLTGGTPVHGRTAQPGSFWAKIKLPRDCRGALACLEGFEPPTFWFVAYIQTQ